MQVVEDKGGNMRSLDSERGVSSVDHSIREELKILSESFAFAGFREICSRDASNSLREQPMILCSGSQYRVMCGGWCGLA